MASNNVIIDFNGQKTCIEGVTRYTTCDDVIEIVFYHLSATVDASSYAVFESSYGVERMLYGKESVLKIMRSWGADRSSFTLLLRKVDNIRSKIPTISRAKRKLQQIRSHNSNKATAVTGNSTIKANLNKSCHKIAKTKDIENADNKNEKDRHTKLSLLKRFLNDVMFQTKTLTKKGSRSQMVPRTPGDGCSARSDRHCNDSRTESLTYEGPFVCLCQLSEDEVDMTEENYLQRHNSYLNAAFVEADDSCNPSFYALNESSDESAFEDESDIDSIGEHERNIDEYSDVDFENSDDDSDSDSDGPFCIANNTVIKCARIIDLFCKGEKYEGETNDEDIDMDSFMNTLVCDSDTDEGLSSLDSDTD